MAGDGISEPLEMIPEEESLARNRRQLGRLYPVLAHDLHAFLNTMVLNLELLQRAAARDSIDAETADRIRRFTQRIAEEVGPLDRMLKAVVGQMRLSDPPTLRFDLRVVAEELAIVFDSYARSRRVRLRSLLPDVPLPVAGDRDGVEQALLTLLLDMIDAQPKGSGVTLTVQAARRQVTWTIAAEAVEPPAVGLAAAVTAAREALEAQGATVAAGPDGRSLEISFPLLSQSS